MRYSRPIVTLLFAAVTLTGCAAKYPRVLITTGLGEIEVEVYEEKAPITAANFLRYVDEGRFDGGTFYRVVRMDNQPNDEVKIEVIQGGRRGLPRDEGYPAIEHEPTEMTGVLHVDGAISMARTSPGTASSEIFICIGDQPELDFGGRRNTDGQGFAAFGKVVRGMDVVREIQQLGSGSQYLDEPVPITSVKRKNSGGTATPN